MNKAELKVIEPAIGHVQDSVVLWLHVRVLRTLCSILSSHRSQGCRPTKFRMDYSAPEYYSAIPDYEMDLSSSVINPLDRDVSKSILMRPCSYTRPVSIGGPPTRVWFDLQSLPPSAEEIKVPPLHAQLQIETTIGDFVQLIEAEVADGIPLSRAFIIGYSNGAAMSILTWLIGLKGAAIGGLGVFAGWLHHLQRAKGALTSLDAPNRDGGDYIPIIWAHGAEDDIIPLALALEGGTILKEEGLASKSDFNIKEYKGEGHEVNSTQLDDMIAWLHAQVNTK